MAAEATAALAQLLEPHGVLAWLATYLVHSTLLLGAAWLVSRRLRGRSLGVEERLWKAALVGSLLTATVQTGLAALPSAPARAAEVAAVRVVATPSLPATWSPSTADAPVAQMKTVDPRLGSLAAALPGWQRLALAGWIGGCLLLVGGLALGWLRLRLRLRRREDVASGPAGRLLERILARTASRRPVRLTGTAALPVPVALGVGEREICLPRRALRELDERRQEGLLAHELAHLERRDPVWLLAALAVQSVFFFQPLNRLARRRLEEISELRCDEWAVRATGDRVGLAHCLTEVASWLVAERSALPAPGMARSRGALGERVRRILEGPEEGDGASRRRWLPAAAAAGLLAAVLAVPGLAPATFADPDPALDQATEAAPAEPATPPAEAEPEEQPRAAAEPWEEGAEDRRAERAREREREWEGEHDEEWDEAWDEELAYRFEHDFDFDIDFDWDSSHLPDAETIRRTVADAMAAAHAAMPDPEAWAEMEEELRDAVAAAREAQHEAMEVRREAMEEIARELEVELEGLHEGRELTAEEEARVREAMARELATVQAEVARAMVEARPQLEALEDLERVHVEIEEEMNRELHELGRELERMQRELEETRRQLERERRELERLEER